MKQPTKDGLASRLWELHGELEAREKRRVTQGEIADEVKKRLGKRPDPSTVGDWFRGATPPLPTIEALAHYYRVRAAWLAFGEEPREMVAAYERQTRASTLRVAEGRQRKKG